MPATGNRRCQLFINGHYVDPVRKGTFDVLNPATEEKIADAPAATAEDVDLAVAAARAAFDSWGATTGAERAVILRAIAKAILAREEELAQLEAMDNGKSLPEAQWDIADAAGCFEYYAGLAEDLDKRQWEKVDVGDDDFDTRICYEPVGVVGAVTPWNYPMLMAVWKVAPALAAGCCVVLKPSEFAPMTCMQLGDIANEAGVPPGVLNVIVGMGVEAGEPLTQHPGVDKLAFTGSVPTGVRVMTNAAQGVRNCTLELGGKSPMLIFEDADITAAAEWFMFGIFFNNGQVCSATSRILVHESVAEQLYAAVAEQTAKIVAGDPLANTAPQQIGPVISKQQYDKVMKYIESAKAEGATVLCGGGRPSNVGPKGYFVAPTVFTNVRPDMKIWREEIFGPVAACMTFKTEEEALRLANDSDYGLAAAVLSKDRARCKRLARAFRTGIVWIGCSQPCFSQAPWGGMKKSGVGRELGRWGLDTYLEVKQVTEYCSDKPWGWYNKVPGSKL